MEPYKKVFYLVLKFYSILFGTKKGLLLLQVEEPFSGTV